MWQSVKSILDKTEWGRAISAAQTPQDVVDAMRELYYPKERMQDPFPKLGVNTADGPMLYLADIILKKMEKAGYPSIVHCGYRSPETQQRLYEQRPRVTKAKPWQSAHQFLEAVDIVHKSKFWNASPEYWEALANAVRTTALEFDVELEHGHNWKFVDSAHIELKDWRSVRDAQERRGYKAKPTSYELNERFRAVLPKVWSSISAK